MLGIDAAFVAADTDDFGDGAIGCAEFDSAFLEIGDDGSAILPDFLYGAVTVFDLDAPMMDAGSLAGELRLRDILAVIKHEGEVDIAVGHVA